MMEKKVVKNLIFLVCFLLIFIFGFCWVRYQVFPSEILKYLGAQIGSSVGVSLTVPENPFNKWARQLQEKEKELNLRERALNEAFLKAQQESKIILTAILVLIIILFFLLLLNFYFDFKSRKIQKT